MKHTKEKWERRGNKIFIAGTSKNIITCNTVSDHTFEPIEDVEAIANAKLISKASELLKTVIKLQKLLDTLIMLTPTGVKRNLMTDENISTLLLIDECVD